MKIIDCPDCGSNKTFVKWTFTPSTTDRETICPKCGFTKFQPWMKIHRTPEGCKEFYKENGYTYTEIEYRDKSRERVIPIKNEDNRYYNIHDEQGSILKKDCVLLKKDTINGDNLVAVVKGICGKKISYYMLASCEEHFADKNFIKYKGDYVRALNDNLFEIIKNNDYAFNTVANCCYINSKNPPLLNKDLTDCPSCNSDKTFIIHEENISSIKRTIVCPECGYNKEVLNIDIYREIENSKKFNEEFGSETIRIQHKNGKTENFIGMDRGIDCNIFIPKSKCILIQTISEKKIIAVVKGFYKNQTSYYLLSNCYDPRIYNDVIICKRKYCYPLEDEEFKKIENNPDNFKEMAVKYHLI